MSATTDTHAEVEDPHGAAHPTPRQYVVIGLILAAVTAVEVALYYFPLGAVNNAALLVLAIAKFAVVAMYFMHLKFDQPILRRLFVTGVVLAIGVYVAYLLMLGVFID